MSTLPNKYDDVQNTTITNLQTQVNNTTGANVGSGTGGVVFRDKTGNNINFKKIVQGTNITITDNTNEMTINNNITNLNSLSDVTITAPATGQLLEYSAGEWRNRPDPSKICSYFNDNAVPTAGVQNQVNWVTGTFVTPMAGINFTIGANNSFTYNGTASIGVHCSFMVTAKTTGNKLQCIFTAYKNPTALINPNIAGLISGSRCYVFTQNAIIDDTFSTSGQFCAMLNTGDIIRFYATNIDNDDAIIAVDMRVMIQELL